MGDDINKNNELNEATLEQVGGGINLPNDPGGRAAQLCVWCSKRRLQKCTGHPAELAEYMREHGIIEDYGACPF